jgi:acyl-CoA synthetase (NDP forming)
MTTSIYAKKVRSTPGAETRPALLSLLEARSVAVVGASARPDSFGARMLAEAAKSRSEPTIYPVNPKYREISGLTCYPALADLPGPTDLVLLGVPDAALEQQLALAAQTGSGSAVIFGNAHEASAAGQGSLRERLAAIARSAGMELCGAGCMGFANVGYGLRAMGYVEPDPLPAGPVALVTHSGSVFSALLRTRRAFGFTLAVSSGQELVTTAASYLSYALDQTGTGRPETKVLALVLEAMREPGRLREVLARAAERDVPVVLLTAGHSDSGRALVAAHSGALAGSDAGWEALTRAYGVHRVADLAEMSDVLELFVARTQRRRHRVPRGQAGGPGIATVHDSGLERAHAADLADELNVPFAAISEATKARLADLLDPGLLPANPLDVWGTGANTRELFGRCLLTLADDESVDAVALAVDLVTELDGNDAYPLAVLDVAEQTDKPLVVISNLPAGIDQDAAAFLRGNGVPVLEGMRTGLLALRHLLDDLNAQPAPVPAPAPPPADPARLGRARELLANAEATGATQLGLLSHYGIKTARAARVTTAAQALAAAAQIGYPLVLKTDEPSIAHKSDVGGVLLGLADEAQLLAGYADLATRLGPAALVCETVPPGVELALGIVTDPGLGPLIVVGAGGLLVEFIADRVVALPPLTHEQARGLLADLRVSRLLAGLRGARPADLDSIAAAITGLADLAAELGNDIEALDINPLICGYGGAVAVDALIISSQGLPCSTGANRTEFT